MVLYIVFMEGARYEYALDYSLIGAFSKKEDAELACEIVNKSEYFKKDEDVFNRTQIKEVIVDNFYDLYPESPYYNFDDEPIITDIHIGGYSE